MSFTLSLASYYLIFKGLECRICVSTPCTSFHGSYDCISIIFTKCHPDDRREEGSRKHKACMTRNFSPLNQRGILLYY